MYQFGMKFPSFNIVKLLGDASSHLLLYYLLQQVLNNNSKDVFWEAAGNTDFRCKIVFPNFLFCFVVLYWYPILAKKSRINKHYQEHKWD